MYKRNIHRYVRNSKLLRILDHFFSEKTGNEEIYHIVSNQQISLREWRRAFDDFINHDITLHAWLRGTRSQLYDAVNLFDYWWCYLTGGIISGTAQKPGTPTEPAASIEDALICPNCLQDEQEVPITVDDADLVCSACDTLYPVTEGVALLFTPTKLAELYPEHASQELTS